MNLDWGGRKAREAGRQEGEAREVGMQGRWGRRGRQGGNGFDDHAHLKYARDVRPHACAHACELRGITIGMNTTRNNKLKLVKP